MILSSQLPELRVRIKKYLINIIWFLRPATRAICTKCWLWTFCLSEESKAIHFLFVDNAQQTCRHRIGKNSVKIIGCVRVIMFSVDTFAINTTTQKMKYWLMNKKKLKMKRMKIKKNMMNNQLFHNESTRFEILQFFYLRLWNDSFWKIWKSQSYIHVIIDINILLRKKVQIKCEKTYFYYYLFITRMEPQAMTR